MKPLFYLLIFILLCTCNKEHPIEKKLRHFNPAEKPGFLDSEQYVLFIVPLGACSGCVETILGYAQQNMGKEGLKFIFCSQGFNNIVYQYFTKQETLVVPNIYLDKNGMAIQSGIGDIYSVNILFVQNGAIDRVVKFDGNNIEKIKGEIGSFLE